MAEELVSDTEFRKEDNDDFFCRDLFVADGWIDRDGNDDDDDDGAEFWKDDWLA